MCAPFDVIVVWAQTYCLTVVALSMIKLSFRVSQSVRQSVEVTAVIGGETIRDVVRCHDDQGSSLALTVAREMSRYSVLFRPNSRHSMRYVMVNKAVSVNYIRLRLR